MKKRKSFARQSDLRPPLIVCAVIGVLLLAGLLGISFLRGEMPQFRYYMIAALSCYVLVVGLLLTTQLRRYLRLRRANDAAELMATEISDMFRYVVDVPYAIVSEGGTVKIVSAALQELLKKKNPICNVPLSDFCGVPMAEIIAYAHNGGQVRDVTFTEDGVPIDNTKPMTVEIDGKKFSLSCYVLRAHGLDYYFVVFTDFTELDDLRRVMYEKEPVVAYIVIDSLQELAQYIRVSYRTAVNEIELRLKEWAESFGGMLREYEREKYLLVFTRQALDRCVEDKFRILDTIRSIRLGDNSFPVTVSIGVGAVPGSFEDKERAAGDALDVALQKGGDQAVVNLGTGVDTYGGRVNTMAGSTSITSRVNSEHLCRLIREAGNVLIMGHSSPDYDCVGSCIGLARLAICARDGDFSRIRVVMDRDHLNFRTCYDMIAALPEYRTLFIGADTAMDAVRSDTLLIMSDVNNIFHTEAPKLLKCINNVVIVDHHRRQNQMYEFKPLMTYIRPGVSSACELVSEMLEYSPYHDCLLKEEANLMLAGMMLDTKNFTSGVGMQTFTAVQYLYRRGAHASVVRRFFTETMEDLFTASDIDSRTRTYRGRIAITWLSIDRPAAEADNIAIAKAADKLMNVDGIDASFALLRAENTVTISARSHDRINVQTIMQRMGGGGHYDMAGAKLMHVSLEEACRRLKDVLDEYLDHEMKSEK